MEKPSFFESLKAGAIGMVKGALTFGIAGLVIGAAIGGVAASMGLLAVTGSAVAGLSAGAAGAVAGGLLAGQISAGIGATVGAITGVMQNREGAVPDAQDLVNMQKVAFSQGVAVGHDQNVSLEAKQELAKANTHFQDQLALEGNGARVR